MTIKKSIKVPLDKYRANLNFNSYDYNPEEIIRLTSLYDLFGQGKFDECVTLTKGWRRDERELIPQDIWEILMDVCIGVGEYSI